LRRLFPILALFLLLLFPIACSAGDGHGEKNVRVVDKETGKDVSNDKIGDVDRIDRSNNDKPSPSDDDDEKIPAETQPTPVINQEASIKGAQTAFYNALNQFTEGIVDALYVGAVDLYQTDLNKSEDGTVTYTIEANEIDPFEHPVVLSFQVITFCFLILVTIIVILGSIIIQGFEQKYPEQYGEWRRTLSGVYEPYNPKRVHAVCMWSVSRPVKLYSIFVVFVFFRNYFISSMLQNASGVLGSASDSIITRAITGAAIYLGALQTQAGEFGIYVIGTSIFLVCMLTDFLVLRNHKDVAENIETILLWTIALFCFVDLINMCFTSFGVITAQHEGSSIYITLGIVSGAFVNAVILAAITVYVVLRGKKQLGV
jgi:hypothetical protein